MIWCICCLLLPLSVYVHRVVLCVPCQDTAAVGVKAEEPEEVDVGWVNFIIIVF